jgi:cellulose synthase operon protein C
MPYERYGITLLPAYNGVTTVSFHAGAYRAAANGTMWAEEGGCVRLLGLAQVCSYPLVTPISR